MEVRVARVVGVHRDGRVAEHRLGARGGDHDLAADSVDLVGELEELALRVLLGLDLEIAERACGTTMSQLIRRVAR